MKTTKTLILLFLEAILLLAFYKVIFVEFGEIMAGIVLAVLLGVVISLNKRALRSMDVSQTKYTKLIYCTQAAGVFLWFIINNGKNPTESEFKLAIAVVTFLLFMSLEAWTIIFCKQKKIALSTKREKLNMICVHIVNLLFSSHTIVLILQ